MAVSVGDNLPDVQVQVLGDDGMPAPVQTSELLGSGKVVLFAVPGAFTPGCSKVHMPGFEQNESELAAKDVDKVACISRRQWRIHSRHGLGNGRIRLRTRQPFSALRRDYRRRCDHQS